MLRASNRDRVRLMALQKRTLPTPMENLKELRRLLSEAFEPGTDFLVLPEIFTCPYDRRCFASFAETKEGESALALSGLAKKYRVYLVGGSIPERGDDGRIYNTSFVFDREGRLIARHRKVHLFDVDIEGGISFRESDTLSPGRDATVFESEFGPMGVCICFDIRFPELFMQMAKAGARIVFVPAAFNMTTGPAHWQTLFKARALDQQLYLLGCAPARDETASYVSYGHSILTDPYGRVLSELGGEAGILKAEISLSFQEKVRREIPLGYG